MNPRPKKQSEFDPKFENAFKGLRVSGASVDTYKLVELLSRHGSEEKDLLATYEELASESRDEWVRYLTELILEDEQRHHRLLVEMANAMAWGTIGGSPESATPRIPFVSDPALVDQTRKLRKSEEKDGRDLRRLRRRLRPFAETTLWRLIVDLMILDTRKHATILKFLESH